MGQPDADISDLASKLRVSDAEKPRDGDFSTLTRAEAVFRLKLIGAADLRSRSATDKDVFTHLKHALWDAQGIDDLFHGKAFSENPELNPSNLPAWPDWRQPHPEVIRDKIGVAMPMDGFKDARKLDSYVMRCRHSLQLKIRGAVMVNLPPTPAPSWIDTEARMGSVALDSTRDGRHFVAFNILKFGANRDGEYIRYTRRTDLHWWLHSTLVPTIRTPKFPIIIVRYQYAEGRTTTSALHPSKFLERLEKLVRERMPVSATPVEMNNAFKFHLQCGIETAEPHLRMFARMLSCNSTPLDPEWVNEQQSHWNGIQPDVKKLVSLYRV